ncbi:tail fiber protein [Haemophilus pittmaniae]|uniref:Tail fiber protein n=1 Tax=Haemophilus pittmaniae TaxID=249188 RepID=A0A377IYV7_9PAST|nr:tail fiber protein [Haemophilus pittmaniae]
MKTLLPEINSADKRFHAGNPATGEQGTRVTDTWLNDVQDRVRDVQAEAHYVLQKAEFQPVENKQTQLYEAIVKIIDDNRKSASTTQKGEVRLTSDTGLDSEELGLTAKAGKKIAQLIATVQLALNNYIPLNKRSSAVNSNDENNVATSKAVKTAYDKGVEAKNAADNAQRSANAANNNANGRVSKSGDTMTGSLTALGFIANSPTASVMFRSQTALSAFLDFAQKNTQHALTTLESIAFADNAAEFRMHLTPRGHNNNTDRREHTFTFQPGGNIWSKKFGWFDQYFGKKPTFTYYQHHYLGASVYKIPFSDTQCLKITLMLADHAWSDELILPEIYNGQFLVNAIDAGGGTDALGAFVVSNNRIKLIGDAGTRAAIFVFGEGPL